MESQGKPYQRGPQILFLLTEHGQLSARTLKLLLKPTIEARRLNDALHRLVDRGLVCKQYDELFGNTGVYYRLSKNTVAIQQIAKILLLNPEEINPPQIRHSELMHSQYCGIWTEKLKQLYPNQKILREHKFWNDEDYAGDYRLDTLNEHLEQRPDVFLHLPHTHDSFRRDSASFAFEIELHQKSEKRLLKKLKHFTAESLTRGVVYVCSTDTIQNRLQLLYNSKILKNALRINYYGEYFLMFAPIEQNFKNSDPILISSGGNAIKLTDWTNILTTATDDYTLKNQFKISANTG